jgi:hypothetical protein
MRVQLQRLKALRGTRLPPRVEELKRWQTERLERTYADLRAEPRYREAIDFFVDDLYGPKDFSGRDTAMLRVLPAMVRILPARAVETAALAIEIEALSEELDHRLAAALDAPLDEASYARAYRASATPEERGRQIELIGEVGTRLDALVRSPLVYRTLKLMRQPARLAGLSSLQDFLEGGFHAFEAMGGADEFLRTIEGREREILKRLFSGAPEPFSV